MRATAEARVARSTHLGMELLEYLANLRDSLKRVCERRHWVHSWGALLLLDLLLVLTAAGDAVSAMAGASFPQWYVYQAYLLAHR